MAKRNGTMTSAKTYRDDDEIGEIRFVEDFLPTPERLVLRDDGVEVKLSGRSVNLLKVKARRWHVPYHRLFRALLDAYEKRRRGTE